MTDVCVLAELFASIGLNKTKADEAARNKKLAPILRDACTHAGLSSAATNVLQHDGKKIGLLLYSLATTIPPAALPHLPFVASEIAAGRLSTVERVTAATRFFEKTPSSPFNQQSYIDACGVGVEISGEEVVSTVLGICESESHRILTDGARALGVLLNLARRHPRLRWANQLEVKQAVDAALSAQISLAKSTPVAKKTDSVSKEAVVMDKGVNGGQKFSITRGAASSEPVDLDLLLKSMFFEGEMAKLHKPGENPQLEPELMRQHLNATGGRVMTRFPPEPNGFLHIGHAKAINIDFGYAQVYKGFCYLRYDDTNPEAEEKRYFDSILDSVRWLGFEPNAVTYSSDYFQVLYDLAVRLIGIGKAYVCHCTAEEIFVQRGGTLEEKRRAAQEQPELQEHQGSIGLSYHEQSASASTASLSTPCKGCVHRDRPIEESLREFERMRTGCYKEGAAVLRMKMDITSGNPQLWDLAAYRIKYTPHCRTGDTWCIYPTYDYTHCLCDSLENITHSLCTLEFRQARESYYWLVDALRIYRPVQWESARLNITNTVLSKRKLNRLVEKGHVRGWDDPRLYTLVGLRRRGVPAAAVNAFARELGITLTNSTTDVSRFNHYVRAVLNDTTPRLMAVLDPLPVTVINLPSAHEEPVPAFAVSARNPSLGTRSLAFTSNLYIEQGDFRAQGVDKIDGFRRLTPSQPVGLMYTRYSLVYERHETCKETGRTTHLYARAVESAQSEGDANGLLPRPRTFVHWVARDTAVAVEARNYEPLFMHANPDSVEGGWIADLNPTSLIKKSGFVDPGILEYLRSARKAAGPEYSSSIKNSNDSIEANNSQMAAVDRLKFQLTRLGYYCVDPDSDISGQDESQWHIVVNCTIGLKESH